MSADPRSQRYLIASGCPIVTTTRYRCIHLAEQLQRLGCEAHVAEWFAESQINVAQTDGYDVIFLYRLAMCQPLQEVIANARARGKTIIFDTDDLVFEPELLAWHRAVQKLSAVDQQQHARGVQRYLDTLLACDAVTVATPVLAELAHKHGKPAFVHRNALGDEMVEHANQLASNRRNAVSDDRVVIGYGSGTATHDVDFLEAAAAVVTVLRECNHAELWIAGPLELPDSFLQFGERVRRFPLADWRGWFELASQFDIAIAPLERENIFCRAKSEIKFLEAGALGVPLIATRIDSFEHAIRDGENGRLATHEHEWRDALMSLIESGEERQAFGAAARTSVLQNYSPAARTRDLQRILEELAQPAVRAVP